MEKIKQIISTLTLKHYIGGGIGLIVIYFAFSFIFSSSSKGINLIPKNTVAVGVISVGDMIEKADIGDLLKLDLDVIEDMLELKEDSKKDVEDESELLAEIMEDPSNIGIDVFQDVFVYGVINDIKKEEAYICASGGVDDSDRLLEILEEIKDEMPDDYENDYSSQELHFDIEEEDDYNILLVYNKTSYSSRYDDEEDINYENIFAFAWDANKFLFIANPEARDKKDIGNLEDEVERLFSLKSGEKLTSISSFSSFYDDKTDICVWASPVGVDEKLLEDAVDGIENLTGFDDLEVEDLQECSASLYYNFGKGNVSMKAGLYTSDGIQDLIQEKTNISTSEFSYELTMKFDDSGDNTIHVVLRSLLTIMDDVGLDVDDMDEIDDMIRKIDRMF